MPFQIHVEPHAVIFVHAMVSLGNVAGDHDCRVGFRRLPSLLGSKFPEPIARARSLHLNAERCHCCGDPGKLSGEKRIRWGGLVWDARPSIGLLLCQRLLSPQRVAVTNSGWIARASAKLRRRMTESRCASNSRISEPSFVVKAGTLPIFVMSIRRYPG